MIKKVLLVGALIALMPAASYAKSSLRSSIASGAGPRVGFSVDPDQVVFGGHLVIGEVAPSVTFVPNLEVGFGDDVSVIALNFDMQYHFPLRGSDWRPYVGAGVGVNFTQVDLPAPLEDESNTDIGGAVLVGVGVPTRSGNRFFSEMKFGLGDVASLKVIAGWNFRI